MPVASNDTVGWPSELIGSTCDVVNECVFTCDLDLVHDRVRVADLCSARSGGSRSLPHRVLLAESPGPGGFAQLLYIATSAIGASAFGIGSWSLNGDRISGLVGNTSL